MMCNNYNGIVGFDIGYCYVTIKLNLIYGVFLD